MIVNRPPRGIFACPRCGPDGRRVRIDRYDAMACRTCKRWLEKKCSDKKCVFCSGRPPNASRVDWNDPQNTVYDPGIK